MIAKASSIAIAVFAQVAAASGQDKPARCENGPAQAFVGGPATQKSGAAIMKATGASRFQWVFEGSPVTTDYAPNRVRVVYNRAMKVIEVYCG